MKKKLIMMSLKKVPKEKEKLTVKPHMNGSNCYYNNNERNIV